MTSEAAGQLAGAEKMHFEGHAMAIAQLDIAAVAAVIESEPSCLVDGIDEDRRCAADRPHGGDEMAPSDARHFRGDPRQDRDRQMAQDAVETTRYVDRSVGLR